MPLHAAYWLPLQRQLLFADQLAKPVPAKLRSCPEPHTAHRAAWGSVFKEPDAASSNPTFFSMARVKRSAEPSTPACDGRIKKPPKSQCPRGAEDTCFFGSDWILCGSSIAASGERELRDVGRVRRLVFVGQGRPQENLICRCLRSNLHREAHRCPPTTLAENARIGPVGGLSCVAHLMVKWLWVAPLTLITVTAFSDAQGMATDRQPMCDNDLLRLLADNGGHTVYEMAAHFHVTQTAIRNRLTRLICAQAVTRKRKGERKRGRPQHLYCAVSQATD